MANISVTYIFTNGTAADAGEVNTNFTDIINGTSDGTKDFSINALTLAGSLTANGNVTLGNASTDTITFTGRMASNIVPTTTAAYDLGTSSLCWQHIYLDNDTTDGGTIYFDAGTDQYIQSIADGTELDIGGFTYIDLNGAQIKGITEYISAQDDYTITDTDGVSVITVDCNSANRTITLPTAADNTGRKITVKKIDLDYDYTVTIDGENAETIDGLASYTLNIQYDAVTIISDGSEWWKIGTSEVYDTYTPTVTFSNGQHVAGSHSGFISKIGRLTVIHTRVVFNNTSASSSGTITFTIPVTLEGNGNISRGVFSSNDNISDWEWDSGNTRFSQNVTVADTGTQSIYMTTIGFID